MANWYDAPEYSGGSSFVNAYKERYGESVYKTIDDQFKSGLTPEAYGIQTPRYMDIIGITAASKSDAPSVGSAKGVLSRYQELLSKPYKGEKFYTGMTDAEKNDFDKSEYLRSQGMGAASLADFQTLLGRLEGSKIRQEEAKNVSARPGIYAQGLANMMKNF
jgi:hypothetical protein